MQISAHPRGALGDTVLFSCIKRGSVSLTAYRIASTGARSHAQKLPQVAKDRHCAIAVNQNRFDVLALGKGRKFDSTAGNDARVGFLLAHINVIEYSTAN